MMLLSEVILKLESMLEENGDTYFVLDDADTGDAYYLKDDNFYFQKGKHRLGISYWNNDEVAE